MPLIARCGFLFLSLLVIFALFEVRYDTLRRRDKEAVSVNARPKVFLRAWHSGVTPCAPPLRPVPPCRDL